MEQVIYSSDVSMVENKKMKNGVLYVYSNRYMFIPEDRKFRLVWRDLLSIELQKVQTQVKGVLFSAVHEAICILSSGERYEFVVKQNQLEELWEALKTAQANEEKRVEEQKRQIEEIYGKIEEERKKEEIRKAEAKRLADSERLELVRSKLIKLKCAYREGMQWCKDDICISYDKIDPKIVEGAIQAKRQGDYYLSLSLYFDAVKKLNKMTPSIARSIYKTLVCAGDVRDAIDIGKYIIKCCESDIERCAQWGIYSLPGSGDSIYMLIKDIDEVTTMIREKNYTGLIAYASNYSGNPYFSMLEDEFDIVIWGDGEESLLIAINRMNAKVEIKDESEGKTVEEEVNENSVQEINENCNIHDENTTQNDELSLVNRYHTKVVGVTFCNDDGSNRQRIIRDLSRQGKMNIGTELQLIHEPTNRFDSNCIQVVSMDGQQIGCLSKEQAAKVAPNMADGLVYKAFVSDVTGGSIDYAYGVNINVEVYRRTEQRSEITEQVGATRKTESINYEDYDVSIYDASPGLDYVMDDDGHWVERTDYDEW